MTESNLKKTNVVKFKSYITTLILLTGALVPQAHAQLETLLKGSVPNEKVDKKNTVQISDQLEIWKSRLPMTWLVWLNLLTNQAYRLKSAKRI